MEDGMPKKVVEIYTVDALSFSEAEERIMEEMSSYVSGEIDIVDLKIAQYKEIFFADSDLADKWYKAMIDYQTLNVSETNIMDVFEYKKKEKDDKPEYEQQ